MIVEEANVPRDNVKVFVGSCEGLWYEVEVVKGCAEVIVWSKPRHSCSSFFEWLRLSASSQWQAFPLPQNSVDALNGFYYSGRGGAGAV